MEVSWNVPSVFDTFNFKGLHNRLEESSSSNLLYANISFGLTRLLLSLPQDLVIFHENPVGNILHDIGTRYVEAWLHILYIRGEAKRVKREILEIDTLFRPSSQQTCKIGPSAKLKILKFFQRSFSENKKLVKEYFKYLWKRNAAVKKLFQSMEDTFEGSKCVDRQKTTITLDKNLWEMQVKFRKIMMLLNEEQLMLPKMLGQLRRDITQNVVLPDLVSCHLKLKEANSKLRRSEKKWIAWKNTYNSRTLSYKVAIYSVLTLLLNSAVFCVFIVVNTLMKYYHNYKMYFAEDSNTSFAIERVIYIGDGETGGGGLIGGCRMVP
ncbi:hypothetical protein Ocin01_14036 [Orchesella cincta]|uniref:Uncharacterized protein n=1 Tax=Orchesella cincta TaxID=48709 RepID=A0A1D2MI35_ORCCI|nr:hypothetical protein Ocin01_14036 [Orchesella cincta]